MITSLVRPSDFDFQTWAKAAGWSTAGVSPAAILPEFQERFNAWLQLHKGPGLSYIERRKAERLDPKLYWPKAKSVLCFGLYYFSGWASGEVKVSNYAWGGDYHKTLEEKLQSTAKALQAVVGPFDYKICVDTAPVLEKVLAVQAGLGWQGKNSLLLNREHGSYLFLGELFTDQEVEFWTPQKPSLETNRCGTCTRCIDACPTSALEPFTLKAAKCISFWNLEHKSDFTDQTPSLHGWLAGCDICQEVCPYNSKLIAIEPPEGPAARLRHLDFETLLTDEFFESIAASALSYVPRQHWQRNRKKLIDDAK